MNSTTGEDVAGAKEGAPEESSPRAGWKPSRWTMTGSRPRPTRTGRGTAGGTGFAGQATWPNKTKPEARRRSRTLASIAVGSRRISVSAADAVAAPDGEDRGRGEQLIDFFGEALLNRKVLLDMVISCALIAVARHVDAVESSGVLTGFFASTTTLSFFGVFISFCLVFRTNVCYDRWWEARCLWGSLMYAAINLAQQGKCWMEDEEDLRSLYCSIVSFSFACKCQLRETTLQDSDGKYLLMKGLLGMGELAAIENRQGWQPYYFLGAMRAAIKSDLEKKDGADNEGRTFRGAGTMLGSQVLAYEESMKDLAKSLGGLIRVQATGLPSGVDLCFNIVLTVFFALASLAWTPSLGWYTAIIIGLLNVVVNLFLCFGSFMENPFGFDITYLPLQKFCLAIEEQIEAIFNDEFSVDDIGGVWPLSISLHLSHPAKSLGVATQKTILCE